MRNLSWRSTMGKLNPVAPLSKPTIRVLSPTKVIWFPNSHGHQYQHRPAWWRRWHSYPHEPSHNFPVEFLRRWLAMEFVPKLERVPACLAKSSIITFPKCPIYPTFLPTMSSNLLIPALVRWMSPGRRIEQWQVTCCKRLRLKPEEEVPLIHLGSSRWILLWTPPLRTCGKMLQLPAQELPCSGSTGIISAPAFAGAPRLKQECVGQNRSRGTDNSEK